MYAMNVGKEIYEQLGGRRLSAMTGAKNFLVDGSKLSFQLPIGSARRISVELEPSDTYAVSFMTIKGRVTKRFEGVYGDNLRSLISENTGLVLSL